MHKYGQTGLTASMVAVMLKIELKDAFVAIKKLVDEGLLEVSVPCGAEMAYKLTAKGVLYCLARGMK